MSSLLHSRLKIFELPLLRLAQTINQHYMVMATSNFTKDAGFKESKEGLSTIPYYGNGSVGGVNTTMSDTFQVLIRHNLGENCSYVWNKMFTQFFTRLRNSIEYEIEYDETMISIRLKVKQGE